MGNILSYLIMIVFTYIAHKITKMLIESSGTLDAVCQISNNMKKTAKIYIV